MINKCILAPRWAPKQPRVGGHTFLSLPLNDVAYNIAYNYLFHAFPSEPSTTTQQNSANRQNKFITINSAKNMTNFSCIYLIKKYVKSSVRCTSTYGKRSFHCQ